MQTDFAIVGGKQPANWNRRAEHARSDPDADIAEPCIVHGFDAMLSDNSSVSEDGTSASENQWLDMAVLTRETLNFARHEMMEIRSISADVWNWLGGYQRWMADGQSELPGRTDHARDIGQAQDGAGAQGFGDVVTPDATVDLAKAAEGQYPRDALRSPQIAGALRRLVGAELSQGLKDYTFGAPMEFDGQFTAGAACLPRECGVAEAHYVFSSDAVWLGIVNGKRMRLFGNPPRRVRAQLLRGVNHAVWRGAVEDVSHQVATSVVPLPADAVTRVPASSDTTEVRLRKRGDTLVVPVSINNTVTAPFMIDSGASDVSVSSNIVEKLIHKGALSKADFMGPRIYHLADGLEVSSETFCIRVLKVGDREVRNVVGSISNDEDGLLLGQSFLSRFRSWSIDNQHQVMVLR